MIAPTTFTSIASPCLALQVSGQSKNTVRKIHCVFRYSESKNIKCSLKERKKERERYRVSRCLERTEIKLSHRQHFELRLRVSWPPQSLSFLFQFCFVGGGKKEKKKKIPGATRWGREEEGKDCVVDGSPKPSVDNLSLCSRGHLTGLLSLFRCRCLLLLF